jgi:putative membrane protein
LPHISTDAGGLARSATTSSTPRWRHDIQGGDAMIRFAFVFAILLAIAPSASAVDPPTNQAAGLPAPTATFVAMAAAGNLFEIQSSELALRRSHSGAVREFANRMVTDHNAAAAKFKQAMADAKLTPPAEKLDAKHQAILDDLKAKDDASFDRAYIEAQYNAHVGTVALFQAYAKGGENARMKAFAADVLPTLQGHLDHVTKMRNATH